MSKIIYYKQLESMDCGPTCLKIISKFYGKEYSLDYLRDLSILSKTGVSFQDLISAGDELGFESLAVEIDFEKLIKEAPKPCILHWKNDHFVVLVPQKFNGNTIEIADPEVGKLKLSIEDFKKSWLDENKKGKALLLHPTEEFFSKKEHEKVNGFAFLKSYIKPFQKDVFIAFFTLLITSLITLAFPYLTQNLVDKGINFKDKNIVLLIVSAQVLLFLGNNFMELIRSWLMLKISTKINIKLITDFMLKLISLPINYFDSRKIGDIQQRILDHHRISAFLSTNTLSIIFSFLNLIVFSVVLATYNWLILLIFIIFSALSVFWIFYFLNKRKILDQKEFLLNSQNQNLLNEMVLGMSEIKLNQAENVQQHKWEQLQEELFARNKESLKLSQYQMIGAGFISQLKNIIITSIAAFSVIDGNLTLGMMLAISFIVGQMNSPLDQLLYVVQIGQDANLSLERIAEIHEKENEKFSDKIINSDELKQDIILKNVDFSYGNFQVLYDINAVIPKGKVTAIVGESGCGKTTLFKLLLRFYNAQNGNIFLGNHLLEEIPLEIWRKNTGIVMQEAYVFSDSIKRNITLRENSEINEERLETAIKISNLQEIIDLFPEKLETKVGNNGVALSTGQKQRLLIARAVYKNPDFFMLDEATSALDARNEKEIMENLADFYKGKTVIVIAHRLSTVKNADQILVMQKGNFVEKGTHKELLDKKGIYFNLVNNQLEV